MANLALTMASMPYDRIEALKYGLVKPEGVDLTHVAKTDVTQIAGPMIEEGAFDIGEVPLALCMMLAAKGDSPLVGLPIFPSRAFRHGCIWVNTNANIRAPKDLEGKRVGLAQFRQVAVVWIKGFLQHEYGVALDSIHWFEGGYTEPASRPVSPTKAAGFTVDAAPEGTSLDGMLEQGELDALMGARSPDCFGVSPHVQRLFPNYRELEREYYRKTGIFPIMHALAIKASLHREHPWLAGSLFKAYQESQRWSVDWMRSNGGGTLRYMLPWMWHDIEEADQLFGEDWWPNGLEANRAHLETLVQHLVEQGLMAERVPVDDLFAPVRA